MQTFQKIKSREIIALKNANFEFAERTNFLNLADSPSNYTLTEAGPNSPVKAGSIPGGTDANGIGNRRTSAALARDPSGAESKQTTFDTTRAPLIFI
jgi:hypothetical protein